MDERVLSIILGGGKGTRLYPLTKYRSKPAVPFGGKHRIIDIPLSNCINSGFRNIYILTQFNSASLHLHIARAYIFDSFSNGFVEILAAEQTFEHSGWYDGTADSVRKNLNHFSRHEPTHYLILSGDQLYRMDLKKFLKAHQERGADITIACTRVSKEDAPSFGIMKIDGSSMVTNFIEKPQSNLEEWKIPSNSSISNNNDGKEYLASMGIYIFNNEAMLSSLNNDFTDFGKQIIPDAIGKLKVSAFVHSGYWEDIGTIKSFYDATLNLTEIKPEFNFYDASTPIYTHNRNLPPSKLNRAELEKVTCSEGCIITNAKIKHSVIGVRSIIESDTYIEDTVCMGADFYESHDVIVANRQHKVPPVGIGRNCRIRGAIIDKNVRIGNNVSIGHSGHKPDGDYGSYHIVDGIYVILKDAIIPDDSCI